MTVDTIIWAIVAAVVVVAVGVGFRKFVMAAKAGRKGGRGNEAGSPNEAQPVGESAYEVALSCRIGGHAYVPYNGAWRCATCGNHVSRRSGEQYGPAEEGRHERRRQAR